MYVHCTVHDWFIIYTNLVMNTCSQKVALFTSFDSNTHYFLFKYLQQVQVHSAVGNTKPTLWPVSFCNATSTTEATATNKIAIFK